MLKQRKKTFESPLLHQILSGPSSVTLNLLDAPVPKDGRPLFTSRYLNNVVVFKRPNLLNDVSTAPIEDFKQYRLNFSNPIETALFVPRDPAAPRRGGYAIYLRQPNYLQMLRDHVGFELDTPGAERDSEILNALDETPSLDAFLLKSVFDARGIRVDPGLLKINPEEEQVIEDSITRRVKPLVRMAIDSSPHRARMELDRFVRAVCHPSEGESRLFIQAMCIETDNYELICNAWRGVAYYEAQYGLAKLDAAGIVRHLRSRDAVPVDALGSRDMRQQFEVLREVVTAKIANLQHQMQVIFDGYYESYRQLTDCANPIPFRDFLASAHTQYWTLGHCCNAIAHCRGIFERSMRFAFGDRLRFAEAYEMLVSMDMMLRSRGSMDTEM